MHIQPPAVPYDAHLYEARMGHRPAHLVAVGIAPALTRRGAA